MLTPPEQARLEAALPTEGLDVTFNGATHSYAVRPFWAGGDADGDDAAAAPEYPALVFQYDTQNEPAADRQPVNDLYAVDNPVNEPGYTEIETAEVYDDLTLTVAVVVEHDNGLPPQLRSSELTRQLWRYCRHSLALNSEGPDGERPMRTEVVAAPTPSRVADTLRRSFALRLHHAERARTEYDTVDELGYDLDTERAQPSDE